MPVMTSGQAVATLAATLAYLSASPVSAQSPPLAEAAGPIVDNVTSRDFAVRADPKYKKEVNRFLDAVATPTIYHLPPGTGVEKHFERICGIDAPTRAQKSLTESGVTVTAVPCLRSQKNVQIRAIPGVRPQSIAIRLGLDPGSWTDFKITAEPNSGRTGKIKATEMQPGDIVRVPRTPEWTNFTVRPEVMPERAILLIRLAQEFKCGAAAAASCLAGRGVLLAQREPPKPPTLPPKVQSTPPPPAPSEARPLVNGAGGTPAASVVPAAWTGAAPRMQRIAFDSPPVAAAYERPTRVDASQWPYDSKLVGALLRDIERVKGPLEPTLIGVADVGLANRSGAPLPPQAFGRDELDNLEMTPAPPAGEPNGVDDDEDGYVDDWIGAGTKRDPLFKSGDVGLCRHQIDYGAWTGEPFRVASHGPIVTSLAVGAKLRVEEPNLAHALPNALFYRLAQEFCAPGQSVSVGDIELTSGFEYLLIRAEIVSLSWLGNSSTRETFVTSVENSLGYEQKLLFIPAGNAPATDMDRDDAPCPPCLAQSPAANVKGRVVVVGAATPTLRRATYSGWGDETVQLYAPGIPYGGLNVRGDQADLTDEGTSYATPYAAFAAGLLMSIGKKVKWTSAAAIRGRLQLSTWGLVNQPDAPRARVVDLVKVAAALHNVVEVVERDGNGELVLRNYVGAITSGLVNICQAQVNQNAVQAIRIEPPINAQGDRPVVRYLRDLTVKKTLQTQPDVCQPSGALKLSLLNGGEKTIDLTSVTQVLLAWNQGGPIR